VKSLRPHLQYANYVVRHKAFVFKAGLRTHAPIWRLVIHDWSKLTLAEWGPYVDSFYRDRKAAGVRERFDAAWLHHQHHNPHHWQHWVLREDSGATKVIEMPSGLVREMVADWMGAGRAITGRWDVAGWYAQNREKILLAPGTRVLVDRLVADQTPVSAS
jgi:hypothetical protein